MELDEIKKIMEALEKSDLKKMIIKQDDFELHLEKGSASNFPTALVEQQVPVPVIPKAETKFEEVIRAVPDNNCSIESPMVGTFYATPAPDQPAFVKVGDRIDEDTVVCIIEAMKVMNEVKSGISGIVAEILIENGHPVEFGTPLFRIA